MMLELLSFEGTSDNSIAQLLYLVPILGKSNA